MATKIQIMKFLQEVRGYQLVTDRQPVSRRTSLHLLESRASVAREHLPTRRKLPISTCPGDVSNTASPVTIFLIQQPSAPATAP
jgi:hypothetical protein